jgi:NAD dependent epimerase/dehydratase family enzyme
VPQKLSDYKFQFKYPTLLSALTKELGSRQSIKLGCNNG